MLEQNSDTTAWGGGSFMLAVAGASGMEIILYPLVGWLSVYLLKKLVTYIEGLVKTWWENRKMKVTTSNRKE